MMTYLKLFIMLKLSIFLLSCASSAPNSTPVAQSPVKTISADLKVFSSADEYLKEAKYQFEVNNLIEARKYIEEALRLDPKNQSAHLLKGVTDMKLGQGQQAKQEFATALQINDHNEEALVAKNWLERFNKPLNVAIMPVKINTDIKTNIYASDPEKKIIADIVPRLYSDKLQLFLRECGFYNIIDYSNKSENIDYNKLNNDGIKIVISNGIFMSNIAEPQRSTSSVLARGLLSLGTLGLSEALIAQPIERSVRKFDITLNITMDIVQAKNKQLVKTIVKSKTINQIPHSNLENILSEEIGYLFQQAALEIHQTLL